MSATWDGINSHPYEKNKIMQITRSAEHLALQDVNRNTGEDKLRPYAV